MAFPNLLKRLFDTDGAGVKLRGDIMPYSTAAPKAGGTASAGTSNTVARGDHVHPAQTIGTASGTVSGTTKLSDAIDSTSGADSGVAATPKAVKAAYDKAVEAKSAAEATSSIDPWNIFPMRVPIAVDGVTFGGSDGRRAIMPGETVARENWIICDGGSDGKGGTVPTLRGRMILGASDSVPAGSTGGSETHTHSVSGPLWVRPRCPLSRCQAIHMVIARSHRGAAGTAKMTAMTANRRATDSPLMPRAAPRRILMRCREPNPGRPARSRHTMHSPTSCASHDVGQGVIGRQV